MSTMLTPDAVPADLLPRIVSCSECEADRRPRMFVCGYHEGWLDGFDEAREELAAYTVAYDGKLGQWLAYRHTHTPVASFETMAAAERWVAQTRRLAARSRQEDPMATPTPMPTERA